MNKNNRLLSPRPLLVMLTVLLLLVAGFVQAAAIKYTCPMHPHYISDSPGTCPICGMDLVEVTADENKNQEDEHGLKLPVV